jgi:ABC-2 type transport system permease protein
MALIMIAGAAQYPQVIRGTGVERAKSIAEMTRALQAFSFLVGDITSLDTIGGYVTSRVLGLVPVMLGLWTVVVGAGLIRGEEQQGSLDILLSAPVSRVTALLQKAAGLLVVVVVTSALTALGLWAGILAAGEKADVGAVALVGLNIAGFAGFWGFAGVLCGQFTESRRKAAGIISGLLLASYLLNNVLQVSPNLSGLTWLLPTHYYAVSKPLVPGGTFEWGAWAVLVVFSVVFLALSIIVLTRRDIGSAFAIFGTAGEKRASRGPLAEALLGSVFGKAMRDVIGPSIAWGLGLGVYGVVIVATTDQALEPVQQIAKSADWIGKLLGDVASNEGYLSASLFTYLPVLVAVFAITQIDSWTGDEEEGRLEMLAAMPVPRWQILLARYTAMAAGMAIILALTGALVLLTAAVSNLSLDAGRVLAGLVAAVPLGLLVAAFGLCVATWSPRPGPAVPVTIALVVLTFFFDVLAPLFDLPEAALNLSIFHLYGKPVLEGIKWGGLLAACAGAILFAAASLAGWSRRDLAK